MRIHLGRVGHFGLAVPDPQRSAAWWRSLFDLDTMFEGDDYTGITNDAITIVLFKGQANPGTINHVAFDAGNMDALREALARLIAAGVQVEDPGNEIGPQADGSPDAGLWFHDPDGYRWELSVRGGSA
ncbi:MAG TPA: VOC family protein [Candidatus Tumulicola sp.]|nr:VOC family protein [Candidatus Tumulicola sp.]